MKALLLYVDASLSLSYCLILLLLLTSPSSPSIFLVLPSRPSSDTADGYLVHVRVSVLVYV